MKKYYLSIASVFKNESWGLKEWLEHYRFHGVDHVYLVNDFSDDNYISILRPFIEDGFVTLYQNDNQVRYTGRQIDINNKFFIPIIKESQWVAQVDCDEYLFSPKTIDIKNILSKYERYSAVIANWVWFNGNGHIKQPSSIVEGFTKRCDYDATANIINPVGYPETTRFDAPKVIINSDYDILSFDVHTVRIKSGGELINISHISNREDPELLINHYQLQSREYWENVKMYRGDMNHIFLGNPRNFELYDAMNLGDIEDTRLWDQNKTMNT